MQTVTQAVRQSPEPANPHAKRYIIAWALALVFYFLEYAARSSPAVMIPQLSTAFGATAVGVSAIIGTYYYTYSVTNLVAGVALDRTGGKWVIAIGAFVLAAGCFGFAVSSSLAANAGRLLRGAGSAFAFTGAVYLATHGFSARRLATAIGVTQCLGMLGGWAGQSVVGPMIHREVPWQTIWNVLLRRSAPHSRSGRRWINFRPELRGDFASDPAFGSVSSSQRERSQFTAAFDVILKFH